MNDTDFEQSLAKKVLAGQLDLGWVGSRAFDTLGVTSLQAIQAPFLSTDNEVMGKVARAPVARKMLAGLAAGGFIGLGLFPDELRHPLGIRKALVSLDDFKGARVRTPTSNVSDALLRRWAPNRFTLVAWHPTWHSMTGRLTGRTRRSVWRRSWAARW